MKVILEVIKGIDKGKKLEIERSEPDNITAGRSRKTYSSFEDKYSQLQITKEDLYLSRWHFLLQMRPPNCFIRHIGHTNPTYINDFKKGRGIEETVEVRDGDVIKAGRIYIKMHILPENGKEVKNYCVLCKKELPELKEKSPDVLKNKDFICPECQKKKEEEKKAAEQKKIKKISCAKCGKELTEKANADGCASELQDVAIYFCKNCVSIDKEEELEEIKEYRLLRTLGQGGMGIVYKAWHKPTGRLVAFKKILPENEMEKKALILFQREISVMQNLIHPNIVRFYESGTHKRKPYFTCEYVPGGNIEDNLLSRRRPFSVQNACKIILDVLEGLSYAHEKGYVHRDISPANMLYATDNMVKLSDMGLSKSYETAGQSGITKKDEMAGKLMYMAPEQITNYRFVKPPADVYSVGIVLYYLLTGKFPYEFPTTLDQMLGFFRQRKKIKDPMLIILEDNPIPIRNRNSRIPKLLAQVVDKAISKEAGYRYPSAKEMKEAVRKVVKEI